MRPALIGIDAGTTNTKVVAFSTNGEELAKASVPTAALHPQPGWIEYDVDVLWHVVCELLQTVVNSLPEDVRPAAIVVTGMAEAGVALDSSGTALYPAISWLDQRTVDELAAWESAIGKDRTAEITGLPMNTAASALHLLWLKNNEPQVFAKMQRWLNLPDYIAFKLSSVATTDYSLASRMMLLDLKQKNWSDELLTHIGIGREKLGDLVASGSQTGAVIEDASLATGLPVGLPVCAGGHDHLCAALGLGATQAGDTFDSMGTAEAIVVNLDKPLPSASIASKGIAQGMHVVPGRYYAISGLFYSGGSIDWVRQLLTSTLGTDLTLDEVYDALLQQAAKVSAGSDGVYFLPHLRQANAPVFDPTSRGALVGLTGDSGPGHIARAVLEGIVYEFQQLADCVHEAFEVGDGRWLATGGGTRNALLMRIKAAVAGQSLTIPDVDEATCLGAALLGGLGVGIYKDVDDAQTSVTQSQKTIECDPQLQRVYQRNYSDVFVQLYASLQSLNHAIDASSKFKD